MDEKNLEFFANELNNLSKKIDEKKVSWEEGVFFAELCRFYGETIITNFKEKKSEEEIIEIQKAARERLELNF